MVCWDCGAANYSHASACWLCHRRNWRSWEVKASAEPGAFRRGELSQLFTWLMITTAGFLLLWSAIVISPSVLLPFLILSLPAGLVTWLRAQGGAMTGLQFTASVLFLAVVLPVLLCTSLVAALFLR